jgi:hypothetical protein
MQFKLVNEQYISTITGEWTDSFSIYVKAFFFLWFYHVGPFSSKDVAEKYLHSLNNR